MDVNCWAGINQFIEATLSQLQWSISGRWLATRVLFSGNFATTNQGASPAAARPPTPSPLR